MEEKELALIVATMFAEGTHRGTVFEHFDEAYELAKDFLKIYPLDFDWENHEDDFDEAIIKFVISKTK